MLSLSLFLLSQCLTEARASLVHSCKEHLKRDAHCPGHLFLRTEQVIHAVTIHFKRTVSCQEFPSVLSLTHLYSAKLTFFSISFLETWRTDLSVIVC